MVVLLSSSSQVTSRLTSTGQLRYVRHPTSDLGIRACIYWAVGLWLLSHALKQASALFSKASSFSALKLDYPHSGTQYIVHPRDIQCSLCTPSSSFMYGFTISLGLWTKSLMNILISAPSFLLHTLCRAYSWAKTRHWTILLPLGSCHVVFSC